jgi:serine/threonine-protein kinase
VTDETLNNRIGDYEILGVLGTGGMGRVFKVRNTLSDRIEAMKILLPDLAGRQELADRFLREIKVLAALDHPNIAALRTALTIDNQLIMIMEYVEGETLAKRLEKGPFPAAEATNYTDQALAALSYAHQRGVIHRDIKPSNMMLTPQGVLKLMDFGIARSASERDLTTTGATLGSLYYMSPEQVKAETTDARSDLYSVGVSLYEMVTGQRPFQATSDYSILVAHIEQPPKPPIEIRPDLPAGVNDIILMAMEKDPARRFQSADSFRTALKSVRSSLGAPPVQAASASTGPMAPTVTPVPTSQAPTAFATQSMQVTPVVPTPPPSTVLPPVGQYGPEAVAANPSNHRGLWMGLGALVVLGVLGLAAVYVPRHSRAGAVAEPPASQSSTVPSAAQSSTPATVPPAPDVNANTGADTVPPPPSTPPVEVPPNASNNAPPSTIAPAPYVNAAETAKNPTTVRNNSARTSRGSSNGTGNNAQSGVTSSPAGVNPADSGAGAAGQAEQAAAAAAQLDELEKQFDQVSTRSNAVSASLDTLRQQQASQGLNLRGDMSASEERLHAYLNKAQAALQGQDIASTEKYLKLAEPELEKIEKFLGH